MLDDKHLLLIIPRGIGFVEVSQSSVIVAFNDECAHHSVGNIQSRGTMLVGVIPVSAGRLSHFQF